MDMSIFLYKVELRGVETAWESQKRKFGNSKALL